jgi:hypothetical protein
MRQAIAIIRNTVFLVVAGLFLLTVVWAQFVCSLIPSVGTQCRGPELDAWMLPFLLAPFGVPALISSIAILVGAGRRLSMMRSRRAA